MRDSFLHFTDLHVARSASYRVDDIMVALGKKFEQIRGYINEYNVKACFISGDIFNSNIGNRIPHDVVTEFVELIQSLNVPVYGIAGNHDMYMGSLDKHPLKTIFQSGVIKEVDIDGTVIEEAENIVMVRGWKHKYDKDTEQFACSKVDHEFTIGLTHLVLGEKPGMYYSEPMYGVDEFKDSAVDIFLNGHIHTPLGPIKNQYGQVFCQPGALRRTNTASEEMDRVPQVTLFCVENQKLVEAKYLPIKCEAGIFTNWKRQIHKEEKDKVNKFIESVASVRTAETTDIFKMIEEAKLDSKTKEILLENLS